MPDWSTFLVFVVATLALVLVPGPAVLYIVARGIDQGRGAGLASALGIEIGSLVHVGAAALGLSALLASSATAFAVVKYLGAAYLVFLGVRTLLSRPDDRLVVERAPQPLRRIFAQGVVVQVLNPKMALFVFAFLPQFVDPGRGSITTQTLFFGGVLAAIGFCTNVSYALVAGAAGGWLRRHAGFLRTQRYVAGTVYLGLGATTALTGSTRS